MADVVITEFMDEEAVAAVKAAHGVHHDDGLWQDNASIVPHLADCRALIVRNKTQVDRALIDAAPKLQAVGRLGVGLDNIDTAACAERGITVYPATGANAVSVAEYVITSALVLTRGCFFATPEMAAGGFPRAALSQGHEIAGRTLGIVGLGSIGQTVARLARPLGLNVIACDAQLPSGHEAWALAEQTTFDALVARADIVTLHVPLTAQTRGLFDAARLAAMKPGAILINTARGGVVDEAALADAVRSGHLGGAALDVFESEPITKEAGALFAGLSNVILSPHVSGVTHESNVRISALIAERILKHLAA